MTSASVLLCDYNKHDYTLLYPILFSFFFLLIIIITSKLIISTFILMDPNCPLFTSCSGMDIFPTLLSLAGVTPPSDRRYDGIDATNILLNGEQNGHEVLVTYFLLLIYILYIVTAGCCRHKFFSAFL